MKQELILQKNCFIHFHNNYPSQRGRLRRIKNELDNFPYKNNLDKLKQLNENKATGVVPGDSDFYFISNKIHFIELKVNAVQSDSQKAFQAIVGKFGHFYHICKSLEEFNSIINNILDGER